MAPHHNIIAGLALAVLSAVFNGSFAALSKFKSASLVHPFVFNLYLSFGVFLSSCIVLPFMHTLGSPPLFCPLGLLAGLLFVGSTSLSFVAVSHIGLSTGQGVWGGSAILVAMAWGTLGPSPVGLPVVNTPLSVLAAILLVAGIAGIVKCEPLGERAKRLLGRRQISTALPTAALLEGVTVSSSNAPAAAAAPSSSEPPATAPATTPAAAGGSRLLGLSSAIGVGFFGGSTLVPSVFLPPAYSGISRLAFLPSFGFGGLLGAAAIVFIWSAFANRSNGLPLTTPPSLGNKISLLAGMASGLIWNLGNLCQLLAMSVEDVPYGVAYPILQASLVVGGLLGIVVFRELRDRYAIATFLVSAVVVVIGAVLLGLFGPSASALPPSPPSSPPSILPPSPHVVMPTSPPLPPIMPGHNAPETLTNLGKELIQIMSIQLVGFLLKWTGAITPVTEAGLGHYVGAIGFPCVLFLALAEIDMGSPMGGSPGDWGGTAALLIAIGLSKTITFALAYLLGSLSADRSRGQSGMLRGAMFAIYGTQSDDIALGVPVLGALFPGHTAPLYVLSAMQALLFNPAAYILLGIGAAKTAAAAARENDESESCEAAAEGRERRPSFTARTSALRVLRSLGSNVLILSVVAGLLYRLIVAQPLPWFAAYPIRLLGTPFAPLVYLIGGFSFTLGQLTNLRSAAMPLAVVALKSLCLPIIALGAIRWWHQAEPSDLQYNFIFLYALLPCANSALVIARMYGASGSLLSTLTAALALNKTCAFGLLFFAGVIATAARPSELLEMKSNLSFTMLWASVAGGLWLAIGGIVTPSWRRHISGMRTLLTHFVLQLIYSIIFVSITASNRHQGQRPTDYHSFEIQYAVVNVLRWAVNGSLMIITIDWARCARATASASTTTTTNSSIDKPRTQPIHLLLHLTGSLIFGLAMALPFSLGASGRPVPRPLDLGTDFWLAYGRGQAVVYAVGYAFLAAVKFVCLLLVGLAKRGSSSRMPRGSVTEGSPPPSPEEPALNAPPVDDPYPNTLRLGVLLVGAAIRCGGQSGLCWRFFSESKIEGGAASVAIVELMMVMVTLDDGQAFFSALLFGLGANLDVLRRYIARRSHLPPTTNAAATSPITEQAVAAAAAAVPRPPIAASPSMIASEEAQEQRVLIQYVHRDVPPSPDPPRNLLSQRRRDRVSAP